MKPKTRICPHFFLVCQKLQTFLCQKSRPPPPLFWGRGLLYAYSAQYTCLGLTIFKLLLNGTSPTYAGSLLEVLYIQYHSITHSHRIPVCFCSISVFIILWPFHFKTHLHVISRFHSILSCLHTLQPRKGVLDTNMKIETGRNMHSNALKRVVITRG